MLLKIIQWLKQLFNKDNNWIDNLPYSDEFSADQVEEALKELR